MADEKYRLLIIEVKSVVFNDIKNGRCYVKVSTYKDNQQLKTTKMNMAGTKLQCAQKFVFVVPCDRIPHLRFEIFRAPNKFLPYSLVGVVEYVLWYNEGVIQGVEETTEYDSDRDEKFWNFYISFQCYRMSPRG